MLAMGSDCAWWSRILAMAKSKTVTGCIVRLHPSQGNGPSDAAAGKAKVLPSE